ncbi:NDP-hexose 2,3-dehydratase family protein [Candidatus Saganbacteria bacterium]|nr:NDP-hexose 2,3-dehydratase family protein [Candidatus Saganbacteria bacterium]
MPKPYLDINNIDGSFLQSALLTGSELLGLGDFERWLEARYKASDFEVRQIPFNELDNWYFEESLGSLIHKSGKFFKIEGLSVKTNFGRTAEWEQPIINQPEIGILGIITKKINSIRYFLMQAKMEPGNINTIQLSPTVQATKSNYMQVHEGKKPLFLNYFLDRTKSKVLIDQLQSEQGARFLRKRNRNMVVEVEQELDIPDDFCWLTLGQIKQLLAIDNLVNMDARSVLSTIRLFDGLPVRDIHFNALQVSEFSLDILRSLVEDGPLHSHTEILSWFTGLKTQYFCQVESKPLLSIRKWRRSESEIFHESGGLFSVMAVSVSAGNREVNKWTQPLIKQNGIGIVGFVCKKINGVLHFLVQAKVEAGYIDIIEMVPTLSISNLKANMDGTQLFAEIFMDPPLERVRFSAILSEEGGRFYHAQNRYMIVEAAEGADFDLPENYIWMTLGQLLEFEQYSNYVAIETRSLLSCVKLKCL